MLYLPDFSCPTSSFIPAHSTRDIMAGEIQEPINLSLLENSIHSGSISFGRFEKEALSWEKRSSFSRNIYLEEAEMFSKLGSVTQMRAHFEAHFKKKGIRFPSFVQAQTWEKVEKDESLWENTSQRSRYSHEQDKCGQEKSQFGDSCVSYDEIYVNFDDAHRRNDYSVAFEKNEIGCSEMTLEGKEETTYFSATKSTKPLKNVHKKNIPNTVASKYSTKRHVVITNGSTKTNIDFKREKELKPKRIVKPVAFKNPTSKKNGSPNRFRSNYGIDFATREKIPTTNASNFRSNEQAEKRKEEKMEAVNRKMLNFKVTPMPKITQARPRPTSTSQPKAKDDIQEHSSKAIYDRSMANGTTKSKVNTHKDKTIIQKSLNGTLPIKSKDKTARNNTNTRSLAVRHYVVEVAM